MVKSEARTVDAYLADAPEERREALETLRRLCLEELAGYAESMEYGMPSYARQGTVEVAFASQKNYISFYLREAVLRANAQRLGNLSAGKGCIRYRRPEQIDSATVRALLVDSAADPGPVC